MEKTMPQTRDRRGQVLHWDDLYAQFAAAAESMPIEEVDRELASIGYDPDKVRGAIGKLGRQAGALPADGMAITAAPRDAHADERLPVVLPAQLRAIEHTGGSSRWSWGGRRAVAGAAGAAGAVLVILLALPISGTIVAPQPSYAETNPAGAAKASYAASPDITEQRHGGKVAVPKKCAVDNAWGLCGDGKLITAGSKESQLSKHKDSGSKSVVASAKGSAAPNGTKHS
jgi:hypothetical protein